MINFTKEEQEAIKYACYFVAGEGQSERCGGEVVLESIIRKLETASLSSRQWPTRDGHIMTIDGRQYVLKDISGLSDLG